MKANGLSFDLPPERLEVPTRASAMAPKGHTIAVYHARLADANKTEFSEAFTEEDLWLELRDIAMDWDGDE